MSGHWVILILCFVQHMRRCQMRRGGKSMTSLDTIHHLDKTTGVEVVATGTITSGSTFSHSTLILMKCSKTLTHLVTNNTTTSTPILKLTKGDTLATTSRPTRRPWTDTRKLLVEESLMTCLRTWRRCLPLTRTAAGLKADSRVQGSSTAGQWHSVGGTWWPPSLTAPEDGRTHQTMSSGTLRTCLGLNYGLEMECITWWNI